ncbi:uncharacterized protein [Montipora foliosa]|uniref:uncharacterized protein isoform X2 n=1 Tax=Montipora foliosa TaxID=591990 RepID=UPI0035F1D6E1
MAYLIVVNLLALLALHCLSITEATHFRNGIITFAPVDSNSNTMILTFRLAFRRTFYGYNCDESIIRSGILRGSGGSWRATCSKVSCGWWNIASTGFKCTDYSVDEDWTMGENNFTYTFPSVAQEWVVSYQGCCWISSLVKYPDGNWLVSTTVNLTRRSDTGKINSSPVSKSPAIVRFKEGCPQSFRIPVEDPDNDIVKCRWATYSESSRYNDSFPHSKLDERTCELRYNGNNGTVGTYAVAITIEDFPAGTTDFDSVAPFSSVGLQFLVKITEQNGSCVDVPIFTESTPSDGECTEVQIGSAYRAVIEVKLQYLSRHVKEIVTSCPIGMQLMPLQYNASQGIYYRNITWYPSQYQVGQQLFCFKAVDSEGSESEWRCITILVGLSNTPRVVFGTQWPMHPKSEIGPGLTSLGIQFDRSIKKPRVSSYITLVLLPSENTVYKVDTLSHHVRISSNGTGLFFAFPKAALSMTGSYAILMDRGAVVGLGCSFDGPPTPGILSVHDWVFNVNGVCPSGYYLEPPDYTNCVDVNECGGQSRKRRFAWWPQGMASTLTSIPVPSVSSSISVSVPSVSSSISVSVPSVSSSISVSANYSMTTSAPQSSPAPGSLGSCAYNLTDLQGNFSSPNYPSSYPHHLDCLWSITVTPGSLIYLQFSDFSVEYGSSYCPYDYVEVSDSNYPSSSIQIKRCGYDQSPWCVWSTSNVLHVRFITDLSVSASGFMAHYATLGYPGSGNCLSLNATQTNSSMTTSTTQMPSTSDLPATTSPPWLSGSLGSCAYNLTDLQGNFSSPNYPSSYPHHLDCLWSITVTPGSLIYLQFSDFSVEYGSSYCPYDYVEVSDSNYPSSSIQIKRCGYDQSPWCVWSTSNVLHVRFVTDFSVSASGFMAHYATFGYPGSGNCLSLNATQTNSSMTTSTTQMPFTPNLPATTSPPSLSGSCANNLTDLQGNFSSPNYPSSYSHHLDCLWSITVTPGSFIYLQFSDFSVEYGSSYCPYDYVEVSDSNYPSSSIQIKRCGYDQSPWCVWSTSNVLHVRFVTDLSVSASGFMAHYASYGYPGSGNCLSLNATQTNYSMTTNTTQMPSTPNIPATTSPPSFSANYLTSSIPQTSPSPANYFTSSIPQTSPSPAIEIHPTPASKTPWSLLYHSSSVVPVGDPDFHLHLPSHCEQTCHNTPGSYSCSCVGGYQLNADGKTCSDINECSVNNGGCSHHCYNIAGAYYCGCPDGTTMAANNLTCVEPGFSVTCGEYNMTVFLEKQSFPFFQVQELHLRYPSCRATENSTHLIINTRLNDCGTSVNDTQDALLFWNELRVDAVIVDQVITRSHDIRLPFYCSYSRRDLVSLSFTPQGIYIGEEVGYGNFTFKMDFFTSGSFVTPYTSNDYPIEMRMNDYIYVRYSVESGADLVIMAENCRATKDGSFYSWPQYTIIQNGCPKDSTMAYSYDPNRPYQEFSMKSFRFFNDYKAIYFHCQLLACHRSARNTRCQSGCLQDNKRKRRAVTPDAEHEESTTKNIVSRGPLFFRQEVNQGDTGANKKDDTLIGGIAGASGICLIAVIALGVMFVKYRIARRLMNRNKVGDLYTTQEEEMRRKNAYIKYDDETKKEDSL